MIRSPVGAFTRTETVPAIGGVAADRLTARTLEMVYNELRRCRARYDGRPFIEHRSENAEHDCAEARCRAHVCRPMAASTMRQIRSIISAALSAAVRWGWIASNPVSVARRPRQKAPEPKPPS